MALAVGLGADQDGQPAVLLEPQLRLFGGLGPMQFTGAAGHLGFTLKDAGGGKTQISVTYDVGGYARGGLADRLAAPVDMVLGEQVKRLAKYVETGKPE